MPSIQSAGPVDPALIDDLVAASHILAQHGVLDAWGHVSMRHPKNPERYLISRARAPALVSAADIVELDLNSDPVDQNGPRLFLERYIHGEAYKARPDVNAVVHSHSPTVVPFSVTEEPLRAISSVASFLACGCPVFEIRDVGLTKGLLVSTGKQGAALAKVLGDKPVALLARPRQYRGRVRHPPRRASRALHRGQCAAACHRAFVPAADQIYRDGRGARPAAARRFLGRLEARGDGRGVGGWPVRRPVLSFVMPALVAGIHALLPRKARRGWPGQARP